jgi:outer membrane lipoprotein-sorting protein
VKKLCALVVLACLLLSSSAALSQDWATLSKLMRDNCTKFMGDVKDLTMSMDMTNKSPQGSMASTSTLYSKGDKFRAEIAMKEMPGGGAMPAGMAGMKTIVIKDGVNVWMVNPMTGKMKLPAADANRYRGQWLCSDYIPQTAEIVGSEAVGGRDCYVVADKDPKATFSKLWIDKKNYHLLKLEGKPEKGQPAMVAIFSDFRKVAGDWEVPYMTQVDMGTDVASTIAVTSVAVNKGLKDDLFNADKIEGKTTNMMDLMKKMKEQQKDTN